jgi:hypothetical protein
MAAPMTAAQTRAQMKKWLVPYKEFSGWTTRKRPGSFSPVGLVIHHTGSDSGQNSPSYDRFLFVEGRPSEGIPGPLCQASCEMDGDLLLGAIGRANHAGSGSSRTLTAVRGDKVSLTAEIRPGSDDTNGNGWFYGLEVKFDGGQPMTSRQYDSAVRWAAAICDFYGWSAGSIVGHKEWSARKPDPGHTHMAKFRRDVAARLKAGPGGTPTGSTPDSEEEELMGAKEDIIAQINAVSGHITDNNRQWANNVIAEVDKRLAAALDLSEEELKDFIEARTQAYAAFGAKHTDQVEATTAGDVKAALADEFGSLAGAVAAVVEMQKNQGQLLDKLLAALPTDDAPKA